MKKDKEEFPIVRVVGLLTFSTVTLLSVITNQAPDVALVRIFVGTLVVVLAGRLALGTIKWAARNRGRL